MKYVFSFIQRYLFAFRMFIFISDSNKERFIFKQPDTASVCARQEGGYYNERDGGRRTLSPRSACTHFSSKIDCLAKQIQFFAVVLSRKIDKMAAGNVGRERGEE